MSWDVIVFAATTDARSDGSGVAVFEDGWEPDDIGPRAEVQHAISQVYDQTSWSDPSWGVLEGGTYSLEFGLRDDATVKTFGIYGRGAATGAVLHLLEVTGWQGLDLQTGKWLSATDDPDEGRRGYQALLDRAVASHGASARKTRGFWARLLGK
jgi:hypothetical protein